VLQISTQQLFDIALQEMRAGRLAAAEKLFLQVLAREPRNPPTHFNLGMTLLEARRLPEAITHFELVQQLMPDHPDPPLQIGNACVAMNRLDQAIEHFRASAARDPRGGLGLSHLALALQDRGEIDEALACHRKLVAAVPENPIFHGNVIYTLQYHPQATAAGQLAEARRWNDTFARPLMPANCVFPNDRLPERRLRVGYVSADFRRHASLYFLVPLFRNHDQRQVELYIYAEGVADEGLLRHLRPMIQGFRSTTGRSDADVAALIRADGIDILFDLKLHTSHNRLLAFAHKPAPVQVTWLGYPGTTGLTAMDYRLTDPHLDPPGAHDDWYAEKSIRLADTFWCYDPLAPDAPPVGPLPADAAGAVTFGSLNGLRKVNAEVLAAWSDLLLAVPGARLLMLAPPGRARALILEQMTRRGITPDRLLFEERQDRLNYLRLHQRIDITLDTFPYNGHTTNLDSFWMGVPVVTLLGRTVVGRAGFAHLMNLGLPELVAPDRAAYVRIAAELARDLPRLRALRADLRRRMERSPLMDGPRFVREMEAACRSMWRQWCAG
jgi:protein O-GlcNAc transferase